MARLTDKQKELILADFHTGQYSQRKLASKYKVSVSTINGLTKGLEPENEHIVDAIVSANTALAEKSEHEANAVRDIAEERTRHLLLFMDSALMNQAKANKLLSKMDKIHEIEAHSRITKNNKETVLGKDKTVELNNTNAQQNNLTVEEISRQIGDLLPD